VLHPFLWEISNSEVKMSEILKKYLDLDIEVDLLLRHGFEEEANKVLDKQDELWYKLSEDEHNWLDKR